MSLHFEEVLILRVMARTRAARKRDGLNPDWVKVEGLTPAREICESILIEWHARAIAAGCEGEFLAAVEESRRQIGLEKGS